MGGDGLKGVVRAAAEEVGLGHVAVTTADPFPEAERAMVERVEAGRLRGLDWFTADRARVSCRPRELLHWAQSIVAVAVPYGQGEAPALDRDGEPRGTVARYAWGLDYHQVIRHRLLQLAGILPLRLGHPVEARVFVDSGRLAERAVAQRAGLGWPGKSTGLIVPPYGTWVFLGELVTDLDLEPDLPARGDCGGCDLCLRSCPTGALVAPYTVEVSRCLSYLTVEYHGLIPRALRPLLGDRVFGCDACQEVCPQGQPAASAGDPAFAPRLDPGSHPRLLPLLQLTKAGFRHRFRGSPLLRARRGGLLRNAAVALGNLGDRASVVPLSGLLEDQDRVVRSHAAWALGRLRGPAARVALEQARAREPDGAVRAEVVAALEGAQE